MKEIFSTFEAADFCHTSFMSVRRWIRSGELKAYRTPGGHHRIVRNDLIEFMRRNSIPIIDAYRLPQRRILIVDDDDTVREGISRYLSSLKGEFDVMTARDGFEAGVAVVQFTPDIVLLDLMMPHMDGFRVCSQIKENPVLKRTRIIVLTGYASDENMQKVYEAGADRILSKPLHNEELLEEIRSIY